MRRLAAVRLEGMAGLLRSSGLTDKAEAWQCLRERFMEDSDRYEEQKEQWGRRLEYAFDFMEAAFGSGQELVIFVTELNTSQVCIWFLEQYECERYFRYNKELLFEEEEREIGKVLER